MGPQPCPAHFIRFRSLRLSVLEHVSASRFAFPTLVRVLLHHLVLSKPGAFVATTLARIRASGAEEVAERPQLSDDAGSRILNERETPETPPLNVRANND